MATKSFPYNAFLRGPSQVLPSLDDADIVLERRDDENLVLMRAARFEAGAATLRIAARSRAILARRNSDLAEELPWTTWLPRPSGTPACVSCLDTCWPGRILASCPSAGR
ncbi:hypothetical protein OG589_24455 [Sphaerisporangium sp. NBC_01403]|uniref:hypothetical protein n=1 Tax=Sphaerisporangium sp. NBC_01403 TaxID=2903599 RepID=UPI0032462744